MGRPRGHPEGGWRWGVFKSPKRWHTEAPHIVVKRHPKNISDGNDADAVESLRKNENGDHGNENADERANDEGGYLEDTDDASDENEDECAV